MNKRLIQFYTLFSYLVKQSLSLDNLMCTVFPELAYHSLYTYVYGVVLLINYPNIAGIDYIRFFLYGTLVMCIISAGITSMYKFSIMRWDRSIEEILLAPMPCYILSLAFICHSLLRALPVVLLNLLVISPLCGCFVNIFNVPSFLLSYTLVVSTCSLLGMVSSLLIKKFDKLIIITVGMDTLCLLSGSVFDLSQGPQIFLWTSKINPICYFLEGIRMSLISGSISFELIVICTFLNLFLFNVIKKLFREHAI